MITLTKAHVWKYKSIEDSTLVDIASDITVLVGKNESGKTAFLEALDKALSLEDHKFDVVFDYPRKDYVHYRPEHEAKKYAKVVQLTFRIDKELAEKINKEVFHGAPIVATGFSFTRDATYGNTATIGGISFEQPAALAATKKGLGAIEGADEVFDGAANLAEVITRIDAKALPAENKLAAFAKLWKDRTPKAGTGWGPIDGYIWTAYLFANLPVFLYFDDYNLLSGKINLDSLSQRKANPAQLTESDKTVLGLFDLAGIQIADLTAEEGYENSKAKLEAIGLTITHEVFQYWKQNQELAVEFDVKHDPKDQPPYNSGKNLYIRVKNLRHGVTVPFDLRSKGFIWFFSFMVWFSSIENRAGTDKSLMLLLDEPGLNLHALAQADFLAYIETLAESHQVIYTTHSPFMVESDHLDRVRVVEDKPKVGTKISGHLEGSSDDSLFPLQAALGYSIAQNLFIAKRNVLVEGPADLILLAHMGSLLEQAGRKGLISDGVIVPVGGLDKLVTFVSLLGSNKLKLAVLHDKAAAPNQKLDDLVRQKLIEKKRILDFSMFRDPAAAEADLEDLFRPEIYVEAFNATYAKELEAKTLPLTDLGAHPRMVERINQWLKEEGITLLKEGGFNHYRVAQTLLVKLTTATVDPGELDRFERIFDRVNELLE